MNNKFFLNSIGVATIIFAIAFLLRSIQTATAAPQPSDFITEGTNDMGKYHVQFSEGVDGTGAFYYHAMIFDSQTGKSSVYAWNRTNQVWDDFFTGKDQIPSTVK